jgi:hypothetical protein
MQRYKNLNGDSNVESFEIGGDHILVKFFGTARLYRYSYSKAGAYHVEQLKSLALNGRGLNSYINKNTRELYD